MSIITVCGFGGFGRERLNPLRYLAELRDPRVERNREHLLEEIRLVAIAAVMGGAESWGTTLPTTARPSGSG